LSHWGFGEIVPIVVRNVDTMTNGAAGLNGIQAPRLSRHGFGVAAWPYYYVGITMVALLIFVSIRLRDSRIGRAWMAIREDEPTAGMNPAETLELAEQIKSLHALGLTILLIEHKLDVVTRLADTVVVMDHGEKIAEGTPDAIRQNEAVLQAYLGRGTLARGMVDA
jgi:hypothetical protein